VSYHSAGVPINGMIHYQRFGESKKPVAQLRCLKAKASRGEASELVYGLKLFFAVSCHSAGVPVRLEVSRARFHTMLRHSIVARLLSPMCCGNRRRYELSSSIGSLAIQLTARVPELVCGLKLSFCILSQCWSPG